ncbi:MAG: hypothetical protein V7K27_20745 [Nostoc sp.]
MNIFSFPDIMCWVPLGSTQPTGDSDRIIATIRSYCRLGGGAS